MKKSRFLSVLTLAALVSSANAATVLFDFNASMLPGTPSNTASVTDDASGFSVTLASASGNLGSAVTAENQTSMSDWTGTSTSFDTSSLESFIGNGVSFGNSWQTFVSSGGKSSNLTLTLSGLVAGGHYQIAVITGCPKEQAGTWNSMTTSNSYESASPVLGANNVNVTTPTGYTITNVVANEAGQIVLTVNGNGSHTPTFNALAVSELSVPEPATASLGILGLAALMMRRRRKA